MNKKIGLLFSLSGTISIVGEGQLQAALLAIDEVNTLILHKIVLEK
jgi:ABC-type branched-subunit amino acid transport system substrate-binding protein